jgi:hypothetical protein
VGRVAPYTVTPCLCLLDPGIRAARRRCRGPSPIERLNVSDFLHAPPDRCSWQLLPQSGPAPLCLCPPEHPKQPSPADKGKGPRGFLSGIFGDDGFPPSERSSVFGGESPSSVIPVVRIVWRNVTGQEIDLFLRRHDGEYGVYCLNRPTLARTLWRSAR